MAKKPKHLVLPNSENLFLSEVLDGIRRRTKPIKHSSWEFGVERVFEEHSDDRLEKLEITLKPSSHHAYLRIVVWEDRFVDVSAFERTKAEKWDWQREGRLLPTYSGFDFVLVLQETGAIFYQMSESQIHKFDSIWTPMLARGPEGVV